MDLEKLAEASHQAWFVAMAKQGWIFGPRLNPDFKTHPWLKPYGSLTDATKDIVRAQVRGTLSAIEGLGGVAKLASSAAATPAPAPRAPEPARPSTPPPAEKPVPAPAPAPAAPVSAAPASGAEIEVLERKVDSSGRMRIGSGLVKKAELLPAGATQVAILQEGGVITVLPAASGPESAFFASVNPDGFMLPKAILASTGASDFLLVLEPGRLVVRPK